MKLAALLAIPFAFAAAQDTATVEGVVLNKVTGAGIGGATVRIWTNSDRYQALSNEAGVFQISGIKPGDYNSSVEKTGYFSPETEQSHQDRPKHLLRSSGDPVRLRFELNPPAVLRGRVIDPDGKPARASVDFGRGMSIDTDADGAFAFGNLQPGSYTLLARPKGTKSVSVQDGVRTELVPTYYPAALDRTQAEPITVRVGAELSGYEIRLQSTPVYRVRGVVLDPAGKPAKALVRLHVKTVAGDPDKFFFIGGGARQAFSIRTGPLALEASLDEPVGTAEDGTFEFPSVRPGEWMVQAESERVWDGARRRDSFNFGSAEVSVGRGGPSDLKIQLAAPFNLSGSIAMSDGSPLPPGVLVAVSLYSENGSSTGGANSKGDGVLQFDNVIPGAHEIRADVIAGNYYTDSILLGSSNVLGHSVELTPASPPIKIVLKPATTVRGNIEDADAGTVLLFPHSFTGVGYSVRTGPGKAFELAGIPPGEYYSIALDRFDPQTMANSIRLRSLMPRATSIRVESGATSRLQLKVNQAPE